MKNISSHLQDNILALYVQDTTSDYQDNILTDEVQDNSSKLHNEIPLFNIELLFEMQDKKEGLQGNIQLADSQCRIPI